MEPQEVFCYDKKEDRCNNNKCFGIITVILAIAFSFVVGLLVGAVAIASEIVASFGAIIVLAVVLGLLLILSIILLICNRKKDKKRKCFFKYIFQFHSIHHPYKFFFQKKMEK